MRRHGRWTTGVVFLLALLLLGGCAGWFGPSIEGEWKAFGDYLVDFGGSLGEIADLGALIEGGSYRFEYTVTAPYPDGASTATWQEGSLSPPEPGEGDAVTFTVTAAPGDGYAPTAGESFEGTVVFLGRDVLVLDIEPGEGAEIQTWSFRRQ